MKINLYSSVFHSFFSWSLAVVVIFFCSCTGTHYLKEGESFYDGAEIRLEPQGKVNNQGQVKGMVEEDLVIEPNSKVFGMRPGVWFYYIAGEPKKKGLRNWIKTKLGSKPILLKDVKPEQTAAILQGNLINDGYFESQVNSSVKTKRKKSKVIYTVQLYPPFMIRDIHYPTPKDSIYQAVVKKIQQKSLLQPKQRYSLQRISNEMKRIEMLLENQGFFYFDDQYLLYQADSTVGSHQVDLYLTIEHSIPDKAKRIYRLNDVDIINDFSFARDTTAAKEDTINVEGFHYIDRKASFRPEVITEVINLQPEATYTRDAHDYTISHLMGLGAFKFVNVRYNEEDSARLHAQVFLTPLMKKSIRLEVQAVSKSNNFVGPGLGVTFTNRNTFRGAERLTFTLNTSYETQISKQQSGVNAFELDLETNLSIPRFIVPVDINYASTKYIPHTEFTLGFNSQNRINYYRLNSFNAAYGYTWQETTAKSHEFYPIDLNFVQLSETTEAFQEILDNNPVLESSFEDQFIMGGRYSFTLNTQLNKGDIRSAQYGKDETRRTDLYFNANLSFAGNIIHTIQNPSSTGELFNQPYSQFVLGDVDFRYYWRLDQHNTLASRLIVGAGYAYGNSSSLPYVKQFSIGGSNSIRAFPARSIGPGTYNIYEDEDVDVSSYFVDQRGDVKLEGNIEYRFDIVGALKGATFIDVGNIWLWNKDEDRPGAQFQADFLQELAVGTGLGLRFDFNFFILRFDLGFPLRRPEGWVADDIDFGSSSWRSDNLVFNIAIGYPF